MQYKNNTEKVQDAMNFGSPLNQIVVLSAIEKYCEQVAKKKKAPSNWGNGFVSWEAWKASCADVLGRIRNENS
tara:strand:+ start:287 stop:505 length:219 start_codon:yes stop_codon:yes gene_type:complete